MTKKYEVVYNYLRDYIEANKFTKNNKMPSENFLCNKFNYSRETVRSAFSRLEKEGWIQTKRGSGSFFSIPLALLYSDEGKKNKKKVGLIIQGQDINANLNLIEGIKTVLTEEEVTLRIMLTGNQFSIERKWLNTITTDYDGLIVDGVKASIMNPNLDCYTRIYNQNIRVIFYNNFYSESVFPKIIHNETLCADRLIEILKKNGHKNIAGIFVFDNYQGVEKYKGYISSIIKYKLNFDDRYVKWIVSEELNNKKQLHKTIYKFLKTVPSCTAVMCANYMLYKILNDVISEMGKKIPDDYSVVCFDYSDTDWEEIGVTASIHPGYEMGKKIGQRMKMMLEDKNYKEKDYSYVFDPLIHEGKSVRNIASRHLKDKF